MSMYQMQFDLLGDALKKIPKEPKLVNARFNVAIQVRFTIEIKRSWRARRRFTRVCFDYWTTPLRTETSSFPISSSNSPTCLPTTFFFSPSLMRSTPLLSRSFRTFSHA